MSPEVPFGAWPSPLTVEAVATTRRSRSALTTDAGALYWIENRPEENGRQVVVRLDPGGSGGPAEVSPPAVSVRSRTYEYGGGAFCLLPDTAVDPPAHRDGNGGPVSPRALGFVDLGDQRVWLVPVDGSRPAQPLSPVPPAGEDWRHGDLSATPDGAFVLGVRERLGAFSRRDVVAYPTERSAGADDPPEDVIVVCDGRDFFAAPRASRTGRRVAWICWDDPDMPWDCSELWVGDLHLNGRRERADGRRLISGGRAERAEGVSVGQPRWCADDSLVFVSDAGDWWQPWRWDGRTTTRMCDDDAEFHAADWVLGQASIAELPAGDLVCRRRRNGIDELVVMARGCPPVVVGQPCVSMSTVRAHDGGVAWLGLTPTAPVSVWSWRREEGLRLLCGDASATTLGPGDVSTGEPFNVAPQSGAGPTVPGLFFPPARAGVTGTSGSLPPLVVFCHSGPTGAVEGGLDPLVQFFTTRGFAVAAVDYSGSTGYGRAFRWRLRERWGIADVDDCVAAAQHLAAIGRVDEKRMAIRGTSAGGFTALLSMTRGVFAAATSWYGVTDLLALSEATHDFEAHYNDWLIGPLPQAADEYRRRSPVHQGGRMTGAVLLLQGLDDPVVPARQAESLAHAMRAHGVRCELLTFEGESHGFRRAEAIAAGLRAELAFYQDVLAVPEPVEDVWEE